ncbi:hypothetical protein PT273_09060 [Orbaceae bacterium ESL0727]|nr:hypothetical protein [Orbaceae bacterium ESL0727]
MTNNQIISNSLDSVNRAIAKLVEENLTVIGFRYDHITKPTIEIEYHPFCAKLIKNGAAAYFMHF